NQSLEVSQEELFAANRRYAAVNEQLNRRNGEMARLTDELAGLVASIRIPILMVGRDLAVRHWTPSAVDLLGLAPGAVDASLASLKTRLAGVDLAARVTSVLETLESREEDVRDESGRWYRLVLRPHRADEDRVAGVVLSFIDIDALKRSEQQIERA